MKKFFTNLFYNDKWLFLLFIFIGSFICVQVKNENHWDFGNYHYYNAWAFLNDRLNFDIVPASINTFFNPLLDLPLYFIIEYFNDNITVSHALQGIWFGLLLFSFFKFTSLFFDMNSVKGICLTAVAVAIATTGQATWFQAGSSTNEIQIAFFAFCSLYIVFKMIKFPEKQKWWKFLLSGLILGCALGLKPTIIYICIASGLSLIFCCKYLCNPLKFIVLFAVGGLLGYLITNGWWMYKLWDLYDNPFFPFLNGIFKSEYFDDFNYIDKRFIPPLKYMPIFPYIWLDGEYCVVESPFYDWRGKVFYTVALLSLGYLLVKPKRIVDLYKNNRLWFMYIVFMLLAYLLWMFMFSIYRYFVVVEMAAAIFFVKVIFGLKFNGFRKLLLQGLIVVYLCTNLILNYDKTFAWWGERTWYKQMIEFEDIKLPDNTLLKLYNFPTAFVIPLLAKNTTNLRAVGYLHLYDDHMKGSDFVERGKFRQIRDEIVKNHKGPVVVIYRDINKLSVVGKKFYSLLANEIYDKECARLKKIDYIDLKICINNSFNYLTEGK